MTAAELNPEFRTIIDARLEAIEQILLRGHVSYSERRHIVGEVETQIFELLSRRGDNPSREDVVAVLDSLDPPESYLPEEFRGRLGGTTADSTPAKPAGPRLSKMAVGSAGLVALIAVFALFILLSVPPSAEAESAVFFGVCLCFATVCGIGAAVRVLQSQGRLRGLAFALFAALLFPLILVNSLAVML